MIGLNLPKYAQTLQRYGVPSTYTASATPTTPTTPTTQTTPTLNLPQALINRYSGLTGGYTYQPPIPNTQSNGMLGMPNNFIYMMLRNPQWQSFLQQLGVLNG